MPSWPPTGRSPPGPRPPTSSPCTWTWSPTTCGPPRRTASWPRSEAADWHLTTGFAGVGYLLPVLSSTGHDAVAYRLLEQDTMPSWRYMTGHGATTIWERWDGWTAERGFPSPWMNSFNHYSLGSVGEWLYRFLLGIDQEPGTAGFGRLLLRPHPGGSLDWARGSYQSVRGTIRAGWKRDRGRFTYRAELPPNVTATIRIPSRHAAEVRDAAGNPPSALASFPGAADAQEAVFEVGSGAHEFSGPAITAMLRRIDMRNREGLAGGALLAVSVLVAGLAASPALRRAAGRLRRLAVLPGTARDQQRQGRVGHRPVRERHQRPRSHLGRARRRHADRDIGQRPGHRPARLRRGGRGDALPRRRAHHSGASPAVSLAFTEAKTYLRTPGSSTLAAAAAAGATTISVQPGTSRSPLTFAAGDTVTIGSPAETDHIASVSGAVITLKTPLAGAHPAGAAVTSTPGAITGDSAFQPRAVSLTVSADGTLSSGFMGGFRFEAITLTTPGTVVLRGAGLQFGGGYLATASDYQGYFLSSSKAFNTMFYDGAYTEQTDMQPAGVNGATQPSVLDGAKRDRAIWSGDLKIEGQGIADTLGSNGDNYVKQSLLTLITSSQQGGGLNADTLFRTGPYSNSYSSWTLDAATTYYRNTGDTAFARQILPWLEGQLAYDATLAGTDGLIVTGPQISTTNGGYDWDFYDGAKTGTVTAFNDAVLPVPPRRRLHRGQPREHRQGRRVRPDRRPRPRRDQRQPAQPGRPAPTT